MTDRLYRKAYVDDETLTVLEVVEDDGQSKFVRVSPDSRSTKEAIEWYEVIGCYVPHTAPNANILVLEKEEKIKTAILSEDDLEFVDYSKELARAVNVYKEVGLFSSHYSF